MKRKILVGVGIAAAVVLGSAGTFALFDSMSFEKQMSEMKSFVELAESRADAADDRLSIQTAYSLIRGYQDDILEAASKHLYEWPKGESMEDALLDRLSYVQKMLESRAQAQGITLH